MTNIFHTNLEKENAGSATSPIPNPKLLIPLLTLADDTLIMSQRLSEWTGHGPVLEQDIAMTNIALDYLGQARMFYQYMAEIKEDGSTEDSIAYMRDAQEYRNHLLVELPNGDWAQSIWKIYFFASYQELLYNELLQCDDDRLAAIAEKSLKEIKYHLTWSRDWVKRLGDGTEESHARMEKSLDYIWNFTGELFEPLPGHLLMTDLGYLKQQWLDNIESVLHEATLNMPVQTPYQTGGLKGVHTEHLGYILADMQWLQRVYPNSEW